MKSCPVCLDCIMYGTVPIIWSFVHGNKKGGGWRRFTLFYLNLKSVLKLSTGSCECKTEELLMCVLTFIYRDFHRSVCLEEKDSRARGYRTGFGFLGRKKWKEMAFFVVCKIQEYCRENLERPDWVSLMRPGSLLALWVEFIIWSVVAAYNL